LIDPSMCRETDLEKTQFNKNLLEPRLNHKYGPVPMEHCGNSRIFLATPRLTKCTDDQTIIIQFQIADDILEQTDIDKLGPQALGFDFNFYSLTKLDMESLKSLKHKTFRSLKSMKWKSYVKVSTRVAQSYCERKNEKLRETIDSGPSNP